MDVVESSAPAAGNKRQWPETQRVRVVDVDISFFSLLWIGTKVAAVVVIIGAFLTALGGLVSFLITALLVAGASH